MLENDMKVYENIKLIHKDKYIDKYKILQYCNAGK